MRTVHGVREKRRLKRRRVNRRALVRCEHRDHSECVRAPLLSLSPAVPRRAHASPGPAGACLAKRFLSLSLSLSLWTPHVT